MRTKGRISDQSNTLQNLGTLSAVFLDTIVSQQNLDYLEYLCTHCQNSNINYFWYSKESPDNKCKLLAIYQLSLHYQNHLDKVLKGQIQKQAIKLRMRKDTIIKKTEELKQQKERIQKLKDQYMKLQISSSVKKHKIKIKNLKQILEEEKKKTLEEQQYLFFNIPLYPMHTIHDYQQHYQPNYQNTRPNSQRTHYYQPQFNHPPSHRESTYPPQFNYPQPNMNPHYINQPPPPYNHYFPSYNPQDININLPNLPQDRNQRLPYNTYLNVPNNVPHINSNENNANIRSGDTRLTNSFLLGENTQNINYVDQNNKNIQYSRAYPKNQEEISKRQGKNASSTFSLLQHTSSRYKKQKITQLKNQASSQIQLTQEDDTIGNLPQATQQNKVKFQPRSRKLNQQEFEINNIDSITNLKLGQLSNNDKNSKFLKNQITGDPQIHEEGIVSKKQSKSQIKGKIQEKQSNKQKDNSSSLVSKQASSKNSNESASNRRPLYEKRQKRKSESLNLYTSNQGEVNGQIYNYTTIKPNQKRKISNQQKLKSKTKEELDLYNSNMGNTSGQQHSINSIKRQSKQKQETHLNLNESKEQPKQSKVKITTIAEYQQNYDDQIFYNLQESSNILKIKKSQCQPKLKSKFISIEKKQFIPIKKINKESISFSNFGQIQQLSNIDNKKINHYEKQEEQNFDEIDMPEQSVIARPSKIHQSIRLKIQKSRIHKLKLTGKSQINRVEQKELDSPKFIQKQQFFMSKQMNKQAKKQEIKNKTSKNNRLEHQQIDSHEEDQLQQIIQLEALSTLQPLKSQILAKITKLMTQSLYKMKPKPSLKIQNYIEKEFNNRYHKTIQQISDWELVIEQYKNKYQELKVQLDKKGSKNISERQKIIRKNSEDIKIQYSKPIGIPSKKQQVENKEKQIKVQQKVQEQKSVKRPYARKSENHKSSNLLEKLAQGHKYDVDDEVNQAIMKNAIQSKKRVIKDEDQF